MSKLSSSIIFQENGLTDLSSRLPQLMKYSQIVLVSHPRLMELYGLSLIKTLKNLNKPLIELIIPEGEIYKSLTVAKRCWQRMHTSNVDRNAVILALGGGVICDLAGFIANCYMRGLDAIFLPSTLLAMVDAAIGGKNGVNLTYAKNVIGTFQQPQSILIDFSLLSSLPEREFNSGMAEIIKYGMIADVNLVNKLENGMDAILCRKGKLLEQIIEQCAMIKCSIVENDEKDLLGKRAELNFGHTFGHAIEAAAKFERYLHGEAVAIGMSCAIALSASMGFCDRFLINRLDNLLKLAQLPTQHLGLSIKRLMMLMRRDKKADCGKINLILLEKIGKPVKFCTTDLQLIQQILSDKAIK